MQLLDHNNAPLLDLEPYVAKLKLTDDEQALVEEVTGRIAEIHELSVPYAKDGRRAVKDARWFYSENPNEETRDAVVKARIAEKAAADIFADLKAASTKPINKEIDRLLDVACRCIDAVCEGLRKAHATHLKTVAKSPFGSDVDGNEVERRLKRTIDTLEGDRGRCHREHASLEVLVSFGLAEDPWTLFLEEDD